LPKLALGSHNLTIYANGAAGNLGISETNHFTLAQEITPEIQSESEPQLSEPFPTVPALIVTACLVTLGLIVYFKRHRKNGDSK